MTLLTSQMPAHNHLVSASSVAANNPSPQNNYLAVTTDPAHGTTTDTYSTTPNTTMNVAKVSAAGFLRKYPGDDGEDLHELISDTVKVMKWLEDLQQREFVGTNSRFRNIFSMLQQMIEHSNENLEQRIEELEKKKWEIENEINLLKLGKKPVVYSDTDIKEQFYDLNKIARELLNDFAEVEQNFEQIRKDIQRKYSEKEVVKGSLLVYALDALDEIEAKDQGKSFKSFWEFLTNEKKQQEFVDLTEQLYLLVTAISLSCFLTAPIICASVNRFSCSKV